MRRAALALVAVSMFSLGAGHACAAPYDSNVFANQDPVATGRDVTATAVDLVNSRFYRRRVTGPGVIWRRSHPGWWY
jgi:hypothetical protein